MPQKLQNHSKYKRIFTWYMGWNSDTPIGPSATHSPSVHRTRLGGLAYETWPSVERPHRWTIGDHRSNGPTDEPQGTIGRSVPQMKHAYPRKGPSVDQSYRRTTHYLVKDHRLIGPQVDHASTHGDPSVDQPHRWFA